MRTKKRIKRRYRKNTCMPAGSKVMAFLLNSHDYFSIQGPSQRLIVVTSASMYPVCDKMLTIGTIFDHPSSAGAKITITAVS